MEAKFPLAPFHEDPVKLLLPNKSIEESIMHYREQCQKYRYMEANLEERLVRAEAKRDELTRNLRIVKCLLAYKETIDTSKPLRVDFELNDSLLVKGEITTFDKVNLWLSSAAMVGYGYEEAEALLKARLEDCASSIQDLCKELQVLKAQATTSEVTVARLYNHLLAVNGNGKTKQ